MIITPKGASMYICTYIMHNAITQSRKVNRGHHTLEMRTNGTRHNTPNTNHLGEKWRRKERAFKEYITKRERLNS